MPPQPDWIRSVQLPVAQPRTRRQVFLPVSDCFAVSDCLASGHGRVLPYALPWQSIRQSMFPCASLASVPSSRSLRDGIERSGELCFALVVRGDAVPETFTPVHPSTAEPGSLAGFPGVNFLQRHRPRGGGPHTSERYV